MTAILRNVNSNYAVSLSEDEKPEVLLPVASRTDRFRYRQNVMAALKPAQI